ncbi:DNA polymerase III subunit beta [Vibrio barjaei]|uniref:DNA polymerase III subunit beta n=1 Tax=Vibrio barjaei TaxID=1676683 RepID=UPI002284CBF1|nr:DNA polymerase III subunit beta [Vibrio barjaei]MCY9872291.1 DNA polymerase III subunit beta [Vibrio barjaei]
MIKGKINIFSFRRVLKTVGGNGLLLFSVKDGYLSLRTTNVVDTTSDFVEVDCQNDFEIILDAQRVKSAVIAIASLNSTDVEFEVVGRTLKFYFGTGKLELPVKDERFPALEKVKVSTSFDVGVSELLCALQRFSQYSAAITNVSKPWQNNINLAIENGMLRLVGTDAISLVSCSCVISSLKSKVTPDVILNGSVLKSITQYLATIDGEELLTVGLSEQFFILKRKTGYRVRVGLVCGEYPSWRKLIPSDMDKKSVSIAKTELSPVLAAVCWSPDIVSVDLKFRSGLLEVSSLMDDGSYSTLNLPIEFYGQEMTIRVPAAAMLTLVKSLSNEITIDVYNPDKPLLLSNGDIESHVGMLVPMSRKADEKSD